MRKWHFSLSKTISTDWQYILKRKANAHNTLKQKYRHYFFFSTSSRPWHALHCLIWICNSHLLIMNSGQKTFFIKKKKSMISFNRCSLCLLINFLQDLCTIHHRFDQAHINTSRKNEALGSHPQVKMKINSRHALKTFTKNNSGQIKALQTSCRPSVVFRMTQHVCLCHGRSVKTDHKYSQRGKQFSITMIRMKSLFSHT